MTQTMVVRRGQTDRYRSLRETFGCPPIDASVIWDRREIDRRARAASTETERRRRDRRGATPSTWSALDFLVVKADQPVALDPEALSATSQHPVDGDVLVRREVSPRGPCTVSRVPDAAVSLYGSYDEAVRQAEAMAAQAGVDLWYTEDDQAYTTLRSRRRPSHDA